ncbi:MAG TPA: hypothetical protein VJ798_04230 [Rhizomicrobium sp.]|nr:hypothetical protein [Rhizomicrobium sp.]
MKASLATLALLALTATAQAEVRGPADAIRLSEQNPAAAFGTYSFLVRATGSDQGLFFLNSEENYRDGRNLSVEIRPTAQRELQAIHGSDLASVFAGKTIWVRGQARRVPIAYRGTFQGYFQHRIRIERASQLSLTPMD